MLEQLLIIFRLKGATFSEGTRNIEHSKALTNAPSAGRLFSGRTVGVIGLRDTVNEARIRSIIPEGLALDTVELRPENEGAILTFSSEAVCSCLQYSSDGLGCRNSRIGNARYAVFGKYFAYCQCA